LRGEDPVFWRRNANSFFCYVDDQVEGILDCCIQMCIQ
jgi:hypothetical protein